MADMYIAQIVAGGWNFAPRGTVMCSGQLLSVSQNSALFSLLGTTYGGDGVTTFGIPDLRGRAAIGQGQGPGLANYPLGARQGVENATLNGSNLPTHTHGAQVSGTGSATFNASSTKAVNATPQAGGFLARAVDTTNPPVSTPAIYVPATGNTADTALAGLNLAGAPVTVNPAGNSSPFSILQPLLAITYVMVTEGIYPSRP